MGADTIATAPNIVRGRGAARSMPQRRCPAGEQQGRQRGGARDEIEQHDFPPLGRHVPLDEVEDAVDQRPQRGERYLRVVHDGAPRSGRPAVRRHGGRPCPVGQLEPRPGLLSGGDEIGDFGLLAHPRHVACTKSTTATSMPCASSSVIVPDLSIRSRRP